MKCPKCGGLMFLNRLFTPSGAYWEWGCIACGYHTDKEIEQNRRESLERINRAKEKATKAPMWRMENVE